MNLNIQYIIGYKDLLPKQVDSISLKNLHPKIFTIVAVIFASIAALYCIARSRLFKAKKIQENPCMTLSLKSASESVRREETDGSISNGEMAVPASEKKGASDVSSQTAQLLTHFKNRSIKTRAKTKIKAKIKFRIKTKQGKGTEIGLNKKKMRRFPLTNSSMTASQRRGLLDHNESPVLASDEEQYRRDASVMPPKSSIEQETLKTIPNSDSNVFTQVVASYNDFRTKSGGDFEALLVTEIESKHYSREQKAKFELGVEILSQIFQSLEERWEDRHKIKRDSESKIMDDVIEAFYTVLCSDEFRDLIIPPPEFLKSAKEVYDLMKQLERGLTAPQPEQEEIESVSDQFFEALHKYSPLSEVYNERLCAKETEESLHEYNNDKEGVKNDNICKSLFGEDILLFKDSITNITERYPIFKEEVEIVSVKGLEAFCRMTVMLACRKSKGDGSRYLTSYLLSPHVIGCQQIRAGLETLSQQEIKKIEEKLMSMDEADTSAKSDFSEIQNKTLLKIKEIAGKLMTMHRQAFLNCVRIALQECG